MKNDQHFTPGPIAEQPPPQISGGEFQAASVHSDERLSNALSAKAAELLVEHLFTPGAQQIPGIEYAVEYKLAHGRAGGDIVDVYQFDNQSVAFSVADISGKGVEAAIHAAMVKYGLRSYASMGLSAESVLRALNRLYIENSSYERRDSFATAFFGHIDKHRAVMVYGSAAHDCVFILKPEKDIEALEVTAPILGVFDSQQHLFCQKFEQLETGTILVGVTDGVTEARSKDGTFYGTERLAELITKHRGDSMSTLAGSIVATAAAFAGGNPHDD
ncbi:MAG: serine/threonine-protein phosphatase, partial [Candidatus Eremiobacteraeota bacterium]|nr:serine/threonine-protein phosphatase [Candidatus Eremiobacteraeota bacterium]